MSVVDCVFCRIVGGELKAFTIEETDSMIVFLDNSPLFPGHCLVCPKQHYGTLLDVPPDLHAPLMAETQRIAGAVERGMGAAGSFIAVNNRVSQTVPHLHIHVVPRNRGDGLKGFFWPRRSYRDQEHMAETQRLVRAALR
jgi:histidine triad (HIT) family protein